MDDSSTGQKPAMEIELKLLFAVADLKALPSNPRVREITRADHRSVLLHSVYFDTPEGDLRESGVALRLRRQGRLWFQTLKGPGEAVAGLHARGEFEWRVPGDRLDPDVLVQTPFEKLFSRRKVREGLAPVFTTEFRRRVLELAFPDGTEAELGIDLGEIRAGQRMAPIAEAEIELVKGEPRTLIDFAIDLSESVSFRLGHASKAERAWRLALGNAEVPRKAVRYAIAPGTDAITAMRHVIADCLAQVGANTEGAIEAKNPEFLHQLRVGFRRLRVALDTVPDEQWRVALEPVLLELRDVSAVLGPARNWDVFASELLPPIGRHCGQQLLAGLRARTSAQRRKRSKAASAVIASPGFARLCLRLGAALASLVPPADDAAREEIKAGRFAAQALDRSRRRLLRRAPLEPRPPAEALHRMRIAAKKLRYTADFFAALYPRRKLRRYTDALGELQSVLGDANDASVAQRMIEQAAGAGKTPLAPEVRGLAQGWIAATEARARDAFGEAWKKFGQVKQFW